MTAVSTIEAQYMPLSSSAKQLIWYINRTKELQLQLSFTLIGNNKKLILLGKNHWIYGRSKSIDIHYHFVY